MTSTQKKTPDPKPGRKDTAKSGIWGVSPCPILGKGRHPCQTIKKEKVVRFRVGLKSHIKVEKRRPKTRLGSQGRHGPRLQKADNANQNRQRHKSQPTGRITGKRRILEWVFSARGARGVTENPTNRGGGGCGFTAQKTKKKRGASAGIGGDSSPSQRGKNGKKSLTSMTNGKVS